MFAVTGGGYLATMVMSFVASSCWKQLSGNPFNVIPFQKTLFFIWHFMQPILMGIIGAEMDLTLWSSQRFGLHISCILMGLLVSIIEQSGYRHRHSSRVSSIYGYISPMGIMWYLSIYIHIYIIQNVLQAERWASSSRNVVLCMLQAITYPIQLLP